MVRGVRGVRWLGSGGEGGAWGGVLGVVGVGGSDSSVSVSLSLLLSLLLWSALLWSVRHRVRKLRLSTLRRFGFGFGFGRDSFGTDSGRIENWEARRMWIGSGLLKRASRVWYALRKIR